MKLVRGAWKLLVGIKDFLVLALMLLFFGALFAALSKSSGGKSIKDGALVLKLNGAIVEQPEEAQAFASLSGQSKPHEFRLRDVVRAIDAAKDDTRVKAVVLDMDGFGGTYPAAAQEVADALVRVRASGKPVLAYATQYMDTGYRIASAASEVWVNGQGGALFLGPGGSRLYYKGLIDKVGVTMHIYRVGKYKSYVEPYVRDAASPEAKEEDDVLYQALFSDWKQAVAKLRPKAKLDQFVPNPVPAIQAAGGDLPKADLAAGLIDRIGDHGAFDRRVAQIAGAGKIAGSYQTIAYDDYVAAHPLATAGDAIGVLTVAGDIVDGKAGAGTAAGDTIVAALQKGLTNKSLKALVVRIDSPGGSALASEDIRQAILQARAQGLPVVISMGSVTASGGYWVSTAGDTIFAEPNTITGSIGIFGLFPTFENTLKKIGITTDGVKTTPLSGQPDVMGGVTPEVDAVFQAGIERGYRQFLSNVAQARHMTPEHVDQIAQGRVWIGGTAHQIGLVDRFGGLSDAIAEAARRAKLDPKAVHAEYLEKKPGWFAKLLANIGDHGGDDDDDTHARDAMSAIADQRRDLLAQALGDVKRMASGSAIQARCLECEAAGGPHASAADRSLLTAVLAHLAW